MGWIDDFFGSVYRVIYNGNLLPERPAMTLEGAGVTVTDDPGSGSTKVTIPSALLTVQSEGTPLTQRAVLDFVGGGITAEDDPGGGRTKIRVDLATAQMFDDVIHLHARPVADAESAPVVGGLAVDRGSADGLVARDAAALVWVEADGCFRLAYNTEADGETLGADLGLRAAYLRSSGTVADAGLVRGANAATLVASRNQAGDGNVTLGVDSSNRWAMSGAGLLVASLLSVTSSSVDLTGLIAFSSSSTRTVGAIPAGQLGLTLDASASTSGGDILLKTKSAQPIYFDALRLLFKESTTGFLLGQETQAGTGTDTQGDVTLHAANGRAVASGTNNDGHNLILRAGGAGIGGSAGVAGAVKIYQGTGAHMLTIGHYPGQPTLAYIDTGADANFLWFNSAGGVQFTGTAISMGAPLNVLGVGTGLDVWGFSAASTAAATLTVGATITSVTFGQATKASGTGADWLLQAQGTTDDDGGDLTLYGGDTEASGSYRGGNLRIGGGSNADGARGGTVVDLGSPAEDVTASVRFVSDSDEYLRVTGHYGVGQHVTISSDVAVQVEATAGLTLSAEAGDATIGMDVVGGIEIAQATAGNSITLGADGTINIEPASGEVIRFNDGTGGSTALAFAVTNYVEETNLNVSTADLATLRKVVATIIEYLHTSNYGLFGGTVSA